MFETKFNMRIMTFNANGIRAAAKKGFFDWFLRQDIDVLCLQETKSQEHQLSDPLFSPEGYHTYFFDAEKKGYSGVGIYTRKEPDNIHVGLGWKEADTEGRYLQADFGNISIASIYLPSGTMGEIRQNVKYVFLDKYKQYLLERCSNERNYIICGDLNIAHKNIDLKNWRSNQKTTGFLPEERAWLDELFGPMGFVDAFRVVNQEPDQYTWWNQRSITAFEKNVGWRIDYHVITPGLKECVKSASIYRGQQFSDHAPLTLMYDIIL